MTSQLNILSESLDKKLQLLKKIQDYNKKQEQIFQSGQVDINSFDDAVEEKGQLIQQISKLDEGFEVFYARLAEELKDNRQKYALQIKELQKKITEVTDLSVSIQAQEKRNKKLIEDYFAKEKANIGQKRRTSKAAYKYYKNMNNVNFVPPQFYDSKK